MNSKNENKPIQMKDFGRIFRKHRREAFVGRMKCKEELDNFTQSNNVKSPLLFILGESGIGKTALLANYIHNRQDAIVHYFIDCSSPEYSDPKTFVKHVYFALSWKFQLHIDDTNYEVSDFIELLRRRLKEVSDKCLKRDEYQLIFIDALDESISTNVVPHSLSIVSVLNSLDFPDNFRVVITSSQRIPGLRLSDHGNELYEIAMIGGDKDNKADVEQYLRDNLSLDNVAKNIVEELLDRSQGNFQYASSVVGMARRGEFSVESLLENAPNGLEQIYDYKMLMIKKTTEKEQFNTIWKVMGLISLLREEINCDFICNVIGITKLQMGDVCRHIEPFLDFTLYYGKPSMCSWAHNSVRDYVNDAKRMSRSERGAILAAVVKYARTSIEKRSICDVPASVASCIMIYYGVSANRDDTDMLYFMKESYFPLMIKLHDTRRLDSYLLGCCAELCCQCAQGANNTTATLFFGLLTVAYYHSLEYSKFNRKYILECDDVNRSVKMKRTAKSVALDTIDTYQSDIVQPLKGGISPWGTFWKGMVRAYFLYREEFKEVEDAYELCNRALRDWIAAHDEQVYQSNLKNRDKQPYSFILSIKYDESPIVLYRGTELKGFDRSELSFVMLLNLAARRKAEYPNKGLAHKETGLLDESQGFKNYGNLRDLLAFQNCSHLLRANHDKNGKLMKDKQVYLDIDKRNIKIDASVITFKSTHREDIIGLLKKADDERTSGTQIDIYCENLSNMLRYLEKNESLVDDAIERLDYEHRYAESTKELNELTALARATLQRFGKAHYS